MKAYKSKILENAVSIHFIGIGGIGMSGIAESLLASGYQVTGSDLTASAITERLKTLGAVIYTGHSDSNIAADTDLVVYSSAVKADNPEMKRAREKGIKTVRRAEMLAEIVNSRSLIAVSGTHGKTTTSALASFVFFDTGLDPEVYIGGTAEFLGGSSSRVGRGVHAIVEADEYDRSFLALKPDIAVINNIELDHTDIFKNLEEMIDAFGMFIANVKKDGIVVINCDDYNSFVASQLYASGNVRKFGLGNDCDYVIRNIKTVNGFTRFEINDTKLQIQLPGNHNVYNAAAAFTASVCAGISAEDAANSLGRFRGVRRRLEIKYRNGYVIYDDYAHHPTEILMSLEAVRPHASGRIITVFQPHTYSRIVAFCKEFAVALSLSHSVFLAPVYPAREIPVPGVGSAMIADEIRKSNKNVYCFSNKNDLLGKLLKYVKKGDSVIFQGAGDITEYCDEFIERLLKL